MQVILMEKVANLGSLGDVVKVKDGFARNFLIPHGKAKRATPANLKEFEGRRTELEKKANETLTGAQERAGKLEGLKIDIAQKAGVDGRLFGSVTNADIGEALGKLGHTVKKAEIRMPQGPLKHIGEYPIVLGLHTDVLANIVVHVVAEQ
jgi:large subunit ribosomal protein L9